MKSDSYSRRIWMIVTPLLLYFVMSLIVSVFATAIISSNVAFKYDLTSEQGMMDAYEEVLKQTLEHGLEITGIVGLLCIPFLLKMFRRDSRRLVTQVSEQNPMYYVLPGVIGVFGSLSLNILLSISGIAEYLQEGYENTATIIYSAPFALQLVISAVMAPVLEELMFRGIIFRRMRTYCIFPLAMLVSSSLFGIYHANLLQFIYATLLGMILCFVYEKFNTIIAPIIVHGCANAFSVVLANVVGIENLLTGTENRIIATTVVSTVVTIICLVLLKVKKVDKSNQDEDGLIGEVIYE